MMDRSKYMTRQMLNMIERNIDKVVYGEVRGWLMKMISECKRIKCSEEVIQHMEAVFEFYAEGKATTSSVVLSVV